MPVAVNVAKLHGAEYPHLEWQRLAHRQDGCELHPIAIPRRRIDVLQHAYDPRDRQYDQERGGRRLDHSVTVAALRQARCVEQRRHPFQHARGGIEHVALKQGERGSVGHASADRDVGCNARVGDRSAFQQAPQARHRHEDRQHGPHEHQSGRIVTRGEVDDAASQRGEREQKERGLEMRARIRPPRIPPRRRAAEHEQRPERRAKCRSDHECDDQQHNSRSGRRQRPLPPGELDDARGQARAPGATRPITPEIACNIAATPYMLWARAAA